MEPTVVTNGKPIRLSKKKRLAFLLALLTFVFALVEIALRIRGDRPWAVSDLGIKVEPGGRFFTQHQDLGYTHLPGSFRVTLRTGYSFTVTHLPNTLRATHLPRSGGGARPQVWVFGCSITHGWAVNDDQTYPWLLQELLPDKEVINFGVSGYGTLHSLIQFRDALRRGPGPELVVVAYGGLHDGRNTFTRNRRKVIAPWNKLGPLSQPCARLDANGQLCISMAQVSFTEFPLMRHLAIAHVVERAYNRVQSWYYRSHEVSEVIINEFRDLCATNGSRLVVAGIWRGRGTTAMLDWCKQNGIAAVDISVDERDASYTNLPHDGHPSPLAHREYADKLARYLFQNGFVQ